MFEKKTVLFNFIAGAELVLHHLAMTDLPTLAPSFSAVRAPSHSSQPQTELFKLLIILNLEPSILSGNPYILYRNPKPETLDPNLKPS